MIPLDDISYRRLVSHIEDRRYFAGEMLGSLPDVIRVAGLLFCHELSLKQRKESE